MLRFQTLLPLEIDSRQHSSSDAHGAEFELIKKPYKRSELATKVRQVIEGLPGISTLGG